MAHHTFRHTLEHAAKTVITTVREMNLNLDSYSAYSRIRDMAEEATPVNVPGRTKQERQVVYYEAQNFIEEYIWEALGST